MMQRFKVNERDLRPGCRDIQIEGELDLAVAGQLDEVLAEAVGSCSHVLVGLERCAFIDSSGIGALLDLKRRMRLRRTEISVVCPEADVWSRFMVPTLDRLLDIHPTRDEAVDAVRRHGGVRTSHITT